MIKIVTDSTSDIDVNSASQLQVDIVPLKVIMNGKEYKDRIDLQPNQFYEFLTQSEILPTTSQPSPQDFLEIYQSAKESGDDVIVITLSSQLSGTYQSACIAKELAEYESIHIIDSCNATQGLRIIIEKAVQLRNEGYTIEEIVSKIEEYKTRVRIFGIVDTLEYLYKGGRLSKTTATMGTLLKFKPIVGLKNGSLELFSKARGTQKAIPKIIEIIKENGEMDIHEPVSIGYTGSNHNLDKFETILQEEFHFSQPLHGIVGPVIGTHAGPEAKLIAYVVK